jgi:Laminin G domain
LRRCLDGTLEQAGTIHYYVARANALENNVSLYYTQGGSRITIKYVDAPVARNQWHTLRVEFEGTQIRVALDGKVYIEGDDGHIDGTGSIGVWTKADSVTAFDDFSFGAMAAR